VIANASQLIKAFVCLLLLLCVPPPARAQQPLVPGPTTAPAGQPLTDGFVKGQPIRDPY